MITNNYDRYDKNSSFMRLPHDDGINTIGIVVGTRLMFVEAVKKRPASSGRRAARTSRRPGPWRTSRRPSGPRRWVRRASAAWSRSCWWPRSGRSTWRPGRRRPAGWPARTGWCPRTPCCSRARRNTCTGWERWPARSTPGWPTRTGTVPCPSPCRRSRWSLPRRRRPGSVPAQRRPKPATNGIINKTLKH